MKEKACEEVYNVYLKLGDYFEGPWEDYKSLDFAALNPTVNKNWWIGQKKGDDVEGYGLWIYKDGL